MQHLTYHGILSRPAVKVKFMGKGLGTLEHVQYGVVASDSLMAKLPVLDLSECKTMYSAMKAVKVAFRASIMFKRKTGHRVIWAAGYRIGQLDMNNYVPDVQLRTKLPGLDEKFNSFGDARLAISRAICAGGVPR